MSHLRSELGKTRLITYRDGTKSVIIILCGCNDTLGLLQSIPDSLAQFAGLWRRVQRAEPRRGRGIGSAAAATGRCSSRLPTEDHHQSHRPGL